MTDREVHDYIRKLWHLADKADPPIGQIRARIKSAPDQIIRRFDYLARQEIPKFYAATGMPAAEEDALRTGGFQAWAAISGNEALIWAIKTLPPGSGIVAVEDRIRGKEEHVRSHLEPYINGVARGADNQGPSGGRRSILDFQFSLIGRLVDAWERATGILPPAGRSDETVFGGLVYSVFQLLGMDGQAEYALRRYWTEFAQS
jgi:hypothetical protein